RRCPVGGRVVAAPGQGDVAGPLVLRGDAGRSGRVRLRRRQVRRRAAVDLRQQVTNDGPLPVKLGGRGGGGAHPPGGIVGERRGPLLQGLGRSSLFAVLRQRP